jgi:hypothetical protein
MRVSTSKSKSNSHVHIYFNNHSSLQLDPDFIFSYIADEQAVGHYSEAFRPTNLKQLIRHFCPFPLGLVPKPHTDIFQMIQDMSYPQNNPDVTSVNHAINADDFSTAWDSFNNTVSIILSLPADCLAATFNISAAYCLTPILPDQQHHLCIF